MMKLNKKITNMLPRLLPCLGLLILFSLFQYKSLKAYYDEVLDYPHTAALDMEEKLKSENLRAQNKEEEFYGSRDRLEDNGSTENIDHANEAQLKLHSLSALLMDAENNRVLYEENGYKKMPMASTTKIMTCIVTLENADLSDIVRVSSYAARMPDVQLGIRTEEQYYLRDLLYSLMLESHNDSAVAIAEHVGGSVEGFATMMNDKARSLGCMDTNFVTPNGLDAEGHYTTAKDLAVIASYAIKNNQFIEITNTPTHQFRELIGGRGYSVSNKNKFLYMMDGAIGVKTGFTGGAGYCFVGAVKRPDRTLVSVVLGCGWPPNKSLKWTDTKKLMAFGIDNFEKRQIFEEVELDPVLVHNGQKKLEPLRLTGDISLLLGKEEKVHIHYELPEVLEAPLEANQAVGYANYYIDGKLYTRLPVYTTEEVKRINFGFCFDRMIKLWSGQY